MNALTKELLYCGPKYFSLSILLESVFTTVYRKIGFSLRDGVQFASLFFQVSSLFSVPFYFNSNVMNTVGASLPIHIRKVFSPVTKMHWVFLRF